jgi:hypothetical protein
VLEAWAKATFSRSWLIQGLLQDVLDRARSSASMLSRSRWGAQPAKIVAVPCVDFHELHALRETSGPARVALLHLVVMMNRGGLQAHVAGSTRIAPCLSLLRCCSRTMSVTDCLVEADALVAAQDGRQGSRRLRPVIWRSRSRMMAGTW